MLKKILYSSFIIITSVLYSQDVSQKFTSAMELYYGERYTEAYKMFKSISQEVTKEDELYAASKFYAADALIKLGEKDMAVAELEYLVNHIIWSNFREEAFYNLGLIYYDFKEYPLVRARFKSLLKEYPESKYSGSALYWIGESYAAENKLQDAVDFLQKAINDKASNRYKDYSIYTLATVYERKGDFENAVKYYDQLLSYYPNSKLAVSAQTRIGICYFYLKDYQSSILELKNPMLNSLPGSLFAESMLAYKSLPPVSVAMEGGASVSYSLTKYDNTSHSLTLGFEVPAEAAVFGLHWADLVEIPLDVKTGN